MELLNKVGVIMTFVGLLIAVLGVIVSIIAFALEELL